jgi:amidase
VINMGKIRVSKDSVHYFFDSAQQPAARAQKGDTVVFECIDCYANQITSNETAFAALNMVTNNPLTGPLYVEGACAGDILKIKVIDIKIADKGVMTARKNAGLYMELLNESRCKVIPIRNHTANFNGIGIPLRPMIGDIGVATEEPRCVTIPGPNGGNMDIKELTEGTTLYLPVLVEGALLSIGDVHAVQGDGETVICALEVDAEVTVMVDIIQDSSIPLPFLETDESYITIAEDESLDVAAKLAGWKMHHFLKDHTDNLTVEEIAMLMSLVGDLRIAQVVNGLKGSYFKFPKNLLPIKL